jgi:hypothetical protein
MHQCSFRAGTAFGCRRRRGAGGSRRGDALTSLYSVLACTLYPFSLFIRVVRSVVSLLLTCDGPPALCGFQKVSVRGVGARGGIAGLWRGWFVVLWSRAELRACVGRRHMRGLICAALWREKRCSYAQAENGEEALLKQLIDAKANLHARDVIYRCCARVSLSECPEFAAPDITLKIL